MSYPLDVEELCELLMSRERIRRLRKDMPDPASDSVMPTANDRPATFEQTPVDGTQVDGTPALEMGLYDGKENLLTGQDIALESMIGLPRWYLSVQCRHELHDRR